MIKLKFCKKFRHPIFNFYTIFPNAVQLSFSSWKLNQKLPETCIKKGIPHSQVALLPLEASTNSFKI